MARVQSPNLDQFLPPQWTPKSPLLKPVETSKGKPSFPALILEDALHKENPKTPTIASEQPRVKTQPLTTPPSSPSFHSFLHREALTAPPVSEDQEGIVACTNNKPEASTPAAISAQLLSLENKYNSSEVALCSTDITSAVVGSLSFPSNDSDDNCPYRNVSSPISQNPSISRRRQSTPPHSILKRTVELDCPVAAPISSTCATSSVSNFTRKRPLENNQSGFEDSSLSASSAVASAAELEEHSPKRHSMEDEQQSALHIDTGSQPQSDCDLALNAYLHDPNDDNKYQLKMTIPAYAAGCIIGKGGSTIVETQKNFHAVIKLSKANECYPFTKERVVLIVGSMKALQLSARFIQEKVREAVDLFGQKLTEENPPADQRANMAKVLIPHTTVGMLIGRQGSNQRAIQSETGVRMEFSPKPDFSPIMERCLTLTGSAVQINMAMDKVLEKIKADPQSGSCPNLVYNLGAANMGGMLGDPTSYAVAASAMNLENLLKLAYASANPYALTAAQPSAASFAYPTGAYLHAAPAGGNNAAASAGIYQNAALFANQAMLDQQTAALYASLGLTTGFPGSGLATQSQHQHHHQQQQQQHLLPAVSSHHQHSQSNSAALAAAAQAQRTALQKEGHTLTALNGNSLLGANLAQQNQMLAAAGFLPNGSSNMGGGASQAGTGHFLADNSSGASFNAQGATGVYMTSLPTSLSSPSSAGSQHQSLNGKQCVIDAGGQLNQNLAVKVINQNMQHSQTQQSQNVMDPHLNPLNTSALQNNPLGPNGVFRNGCSTLENQTQSLLEHNQSSLGNINSQTLEVEDNIVGAILGVAGKTLIEIQNLSNTRIQVSPKGDPSSELRRLTVVGSPQSVLTAVMLIEQRIRKTQDLRAIQGKVTV